MKMFTIATQAENEMTDLLKMIEQSTVTTEIQSDIVAAEEFVQSAIGEMVAEKNDLMSILHARYGVGK
jgi:homoserine acetyltransferase